MTTLPPLPSTSVPNLGQALVAQPAKIISLPKALSNISQPTVIQGQVTAVQANGTTTIQTPQGDMTLRLPTTLPIGTKIDLQIPVGTPPQSVTVQQSSQSNGRQPAPNMSSQSQNGPTATTTTPQQAASYQPVKDSLGTLNQAAQKGNTTQGQTLLMNGQSVRLSPLPAALQSQGAIAGQFQRAPLPTINQTMALFSPQTALVGQVIGAPLSTAPTIKATSLNALLRTTLFPKNITFHVSGDRSPRPLPTTLNLPPQTHATGNPISVPKNAFQDTHAQSPQPISQTRTHIHQDVRVMMAQTPPHIIPPQTPSVSLGNVAADMSLFTLFSGQSIAMATGYITESGNPILQMQNQNGQTQFMTLNYPARNIPPGTHIVFSPTGHNATSQIAGNQWPAMQNVIDDLQQLLPLPQFQNMMNAMPQANNAQQFPAAALLFLAAAKGGDLSGWLGPKSIRALSDSPTGKNALNRLLSDIASQSTGRTATKQDPPQVQTSNDWRGYTLPLALESDIQSMTLWAKQDTESTGMDTSKKATRFFIDLNLSRMGDVHFDGLIDTDKKSLNLSFLTQRSLGAPMQDMLKSIWIKILDGLGYSGTLIFKDI